jgi:cobalt/nickel transport protein
VKRATRVSCLALAAVLATTLQPAAHEFWLEALDFHPEPSDRLLAKALVGQTLKGEGIGYFPEVIAHLDLTRGAEATPLNGTVGQLPAVDAAPLGDGLQVLRFQSENYQVTYPTLAKFAVFLDEWDQGWAIEVGASKGFPVEDIREVYFRYAKALIDVGTGAGSDPGLGMPFELVALTNPYAEPVPQAVVLELRFKQAPLADAVVKVFRRAPDGAVEVERLRTDASGRVGVPRRPGFYLANAVYLAEASPRMQMFLGASWQSLWASITYEIE